MLKKFKQDLDRVNEEVDISDSTLSAVDDDSDIQDMFLVDSSDDDVDDTDIEKLIDNLPIGRLSPKDIDKITESFDTGVVFEGDIEELYSDGDDEPKKIKKGSIITEELNKNKNLKPIKSTNEVKTKNPFKNFTKTAKAEEASEADVSTDVDIMNPVSKSNPRHRTTKGSLLSSDTNQEIEIK